MSEAEQIIRAAWFRYHAEGTVLVVSSAQFEDFKAAGLPEYMMVLNEPLPVIDGTDTDI